MRLLEKPISAPPLTGPCPARWLPALPFAGLFLCRLGAGRVLPGAKRYVFAPGNCYFRLRGALEGRFAPGNSFFLSLGAERGLSAPGAAQIILFSARFRVKRTFFIATKNRQSAHYQNEKYLIQN